MTFSDLLLSQRIDPRTVVVLRHRPIEPELRRKLPWLAAERPEVFNAYQQQQGEQLEKVMAQLAGTGFVASFIGHEPARALYVGLYAIARALPATPAHLDKRSAIQELAKLGSRIDVSARRLWFDLDKTDVYQHWVGKLIIDWPPPERSWWRRAHRNDFPVEAVLEESALTGAMPRWNELEVSWTDLDVLPTSWRAALSQWRGIYYIFDRSDGKGYVGSAYGADNLLGRWRNYAARGHGGNTLLRARDPATFRFSILERVSPDMGAAEIVELENSWKRRLHTRQPFGLNEN